jgi:hypothetical protein
LVQQPVRHVGTHAGPLQDLMRVIRCQLHRPPVAPGTSLGQE